MLGYEGNDGQFCSKCAEFDDVAERLKEIMAPTYAVLDRPIGLL